MSNEIIITDTEKRKVAIDIQLGYTNKMFNSISISRELKGSHKEHNVIVISIEELIKIYEEVFKIVIGTSI